MNAPARVLTGTVVWLCTATLLAGGCAGVAPTTSPKTTGAASPTIQEAMQEAYNGPKARVAVSRFTIKAAQAPGVIGDGLADMLTTALFQTNQFIVLERQLIADVLAEQDLGTSGRIQAATAAKIGQIEGAELLVTGIVTEFDPGNTGARAGVGSQIGGTIGSALGGGLGYLGYGAHLLGSLVGSFVGSIRTSHLAIDVRIIDTKTARIVAATSVEGKATDLGGMTGLAGVDLGVGLSGFAKTPMEKAIRIAIGEAVKFIAHRTPPHYFRHEEATVTVAPTAIPAPTPVAVRTTDPPREPSSHTRTEGSGFLLRGSRLVLTNHHVIEGAKDIRVVIRGREHIAEPLRQDKKNDLALLSLVGIELGADDGLSVDPSIRVRPGESIFVIGYPLGEQLGRDPSITSGLVNATGGPGDDPTLFRISAPVHPGSSGGPILNQYGQVVGVVASAFRGKLVEGIALGTKISVAGAILADEVPSVALTAEPMTPERIFQLASPSVVRVIGR